MELRLSNSYHNTELSLHLLCGLSNPFSQLPNGICWGNFASSHDDGPTLFIPPTSSNKAKSGKNAEGSKTGSKGDFSGGFGDGFGGFDSNFGKKKGKKKGGKGKKKNLFSFDNFGKGFGKSAEFGKGFEKTFGDAKSNSANFSGCGKGLKGKGFRKEFGSDSGSCENGFGKGFPKKKGGGYHMRRTSADLPAMSATCNCKKQLYSGDIC